MNLEDSNEKAPEKASPTLPTLPLTPYRSLPLTSERSLEVTPKTTFACGLPARIWVVGGHITRRVTCKTPGRWTRWRMSIREGEVWRCQRCSRDYRWNDDMGWVYLGQCTNLYEIEQDLAELLTDPRIDVLSAAIKICEETADEYHHIPESRDSMLLCAGLIRDFRNMFTTPKSV